MWVEVNALSKSVLSLAVLADPSLSNTLQDVAVHFLITALLSLNHLDTHILITFNFHVFLWLIELTPQTSGIREIIKIIKTFVCKTFIEVAETSQDDALRKHLIQAIDNFLELTLCVLMILIVFNVLSKHVDLNLCFGLKVM